MRFSRKQSAALITSAPVSPDHEYNQRRRRYTVMMGLRIVLLVAASLTYTISLWIALTLVVAGAVLPWCAVLIANDGPPRKRRPPLARVTPQSASQLPGAGPDRVVDG